jgi:hypothetical protein
MSSTLTSPQPCPTEADQFNHSAIGNCPSMDFYKLVAQIKISTLTYPQTCPTVADHFKGYSVAEADEWGGESCHR